jgi:hypothetical protein
VTVSENNPELSPIKTAIDAILFDSKTAVQAWKELLRPDRPAWQALLQKFVAWENDRPLAQEWRRELWRQVATDLAGYWKRLNPSILALSLKKYALDLWQRWATPDDEGDAIDLERIADNLRTSFASAVAAFWTRRIVHDPDAIGPRQFEWLCHAAGLPDAPAGLIQPWPPGTEAGKQLSLAIAVLLKERPDACPGLIRARLWTQFWLAGPTAWYRHDWLAGTTARTCRFATVAPRDDTAALHEIALVKLEAGGGGLVESPKLWNRPLGRKFVATFQEAFQATWKENDSAPALAWTIRTLKDGKSHEPLLDQSHGLAVQVLCRVLRDHLHHDKDCLFSAHMSGGEARFVAGLGTKSKEAAEHGIRRFIFSRKGCTEALPLSRQDIERIDLDDEKKPGESDVDTAVRLAARTHDAMLAYFQGRARTAQRHGTGVFPGGASAQRLVRSAGRAATLAG